MSNIKFEIISEEEFNADDLNPLTALGGCSDYGDEYGLGTWLYEIDVSVTNQNEQKRRFVVGFEPVERNNGMRNYSGYEIQAAENYGDADELIAFCGDDESVMDDLHERAKAAAKAERKRLIALLKAGQLDLED